MGDSLQTLNEIDSIEIARSIECDCSELAKRINIKRNDFTVVAQNIRSISCNFDDFMLTFSNFKFETDVIILTECRLTPGKIIPQLSNYSSYNTSHQLNQNDGVVVYIKNNLKSKVKEIKLSQASCLQLDILNNIVLCIYRSPSNQNTEAFISSLSSHLDTLQTQKNIIIAGDININIRPKDVESSYEQRNRTTYLDTLSLYGILPGHTLPTRNENCLDHFMLKINKQKTSASIAILHTSITDHYTTLLALSKLKNTPLANKTRTTVDFEQALKYIQESNLADLLFCNDPETLTYLLVNKLTESINKNTIITKIPNSKRIIKPWITPGILRCIKNRNKLQKDNKRDPYNDILKITYIRYRNHCNNLIKKLKRKYERELITKSITNSKLLWKNIKTITFTNKPNNCNTDLLNIKSTPLDSVNYINEYFANIGKSLAQKIQPNLDCDQIGPHCSQRTQPNSFVMLDTDDVEVNHILMSLKSDSASGWDNVSTAFLKHIRKEVVPIITHLANLCFGKGIFPTYLKLAIITPVHKGGDSDDVSNFRPISVLPCLSKILEKLMNTRLLTYLKDFNVLSESQFGFRRGISTEDAVTALSNHLTEQLDKGKKCITAFLDLKKAFDTVSVPILVRKLEGIGIRGTPLCLFKDYLRNRKQRVRVGQYTSEDAYTSYGVPQGSVLGPTLFLIYVNELCNINIANAQVFCYADDTAVVFTGDTWQNVRLSAETGLAKIAKWLSLNLLTLNVSKTNYICFSVGRRTQPGEDFNVKIHNCDNGNHNSCDCSTINKVTHIKYLGVIMDQRLSWYPHIEQVANRIRKLSWMFRTLRYVVPRTAGNHSSHQKDFLKIIYVALVQSVLSYCIPVWGGAAKTKFLTLERAQRALIKCMYFKKKRYPTEDLFRLSNLLSVRKLYITQIILKKHKSLSYDAGILSKRRNDMILNVPRTRTSFASMQFSKRSAALYNKINKYIYIYPKNYYDSKKIIMEWIQTLTYNDTETLLKP